MVKIKELFIHLRSSFWFLPTLIVISSSLLAFGLVELDSVSDIDLLSKWPRIFGASPESSRGILSTVASSVIAMMTVTFSMTLVTLSLASSQYTSRIIRNFMRSYVTQTVLGVFSGIFVYCLIVLRTIRGAEGEAFVPSFSILIGVLLGLLGVIFLIVFIHHIASSVQASNILDAIRKETLLSIENMFPEDLGDEEEDDIEVSELPSLNKSIASHESGYIQNVSESGLLEMARKWDTVIQINYGIGEFVVEGTPLINVSEKVEIDDEKVAELQNAFSIRRHRTIEQDPGFGIRQIVDISLKALSPGINDTTTAIMTIDQLTVILSHLIKKRIPSQYRYDQGELIAIVKSPGMEGYLDECFGQIRSDGSDNQAVVEKLVWALKTLLYFSKSPKVTALLLSEIEKTEEFMSENSFAPSESAKMKRMFSDAKSQSSLIQ